MKKKTLVTAVPLPVPFSNDGSHVDNVNFTFKEATASLADAICCLATSIPTTNHSLAFPQIAARFCDNKFNDLCKEFGLPPGFVIDLRTGFGVDDTEVRKQVAQLIRKNKPVL